MKKKIALLLMAAMTISTLAACGNSAAEQAPASTTEEAPAEEAAPAEEEAPAEEAAPEEEAPAEEAAPAADGELITVGFAQVGHESDWRAANTKNYQDTFSEANGYELSFVDCDNDHAAHKS